MVRKKKERWNRRRRRTRVRSSFNKAHRRSATTAVYLMALIEVAHCLSFALSSVKPTFKNLHSVRIVDFSNFSFDYFSLFSLVQLISFLTTLSFMTLMSSNVLLLFLHF